MSIKAIAILVRILLTANIHAQTPVSSVTGTVTAEGAVRMMQSQRNDSRSAPIPLQFGNKFVKPY